MLWFIGHLKASYKPVANHVGEKQNYLAVQGAQNKTTDQPKDNFFEILYQCYKDALRLQELSPMIQPEKAAITLFIARSKINGNGHAN